MTYDVIIIGGGPAGLSAALVLGRCRRRVLMLDAGKPRNRAARAVHGFLTRDGVPPLELIQIARDQLAPYPSVEFRDAEVVDAERNDSSVTVTLSDGRTERCRKLLLAIGVIDELPEIVGSQEMYGVSVFHCPYCDGWEWRDQPVAIYGKGETGYSLAMELICWTKDLVLCTDGEGGLDESQRRRLRQNGIEIREEEIVRLEGTDGQLERVLFANGDHLARSALFFGTENRIACGFIEKIGCSINEKGTISTGEMEKTGIRGVYCAGDASTASQFAIIAAAEGAQAAIAINRELLQEDIGK